MNLARPGRACAASRRQKRWRGSALRRGRRTAISPSPARSPVAQSSLERYFTATSNAAKSENPGEGQLFVSRRASGAISLSFQRRPPAAAPNDRKRGGARLHELAARTTTESFAASPCCSTSTARSSRVLALETLRVAQGASSYLIKSTNAYGKASASEGLGVAAIKVGDIVIPTQPASDLRVWFAKDDPRRVNSRLESSCSRRRPVRSRRQDRPRRRERLAAFGYCRDAAQSVDARAWKRTRN